MTEKIKQLLKSNLPIGGFEQNRELEWAHVYHDSIRDREWLQKLSLNIGRWAGSYPFFYVLNRVLNDYKPKGILEFGLGESSKVISTYLDNLLLDTNHLVIEQDENWKNHFQSIFNLSQRSSVEIFPLEEKLVKGFKTKAYSGVENYIDKKYDLYLVDGPFGSKNYSRYDLVNILKNNVDKNDEFIIIFDDVNRKGEKQTFNDLIKLLKGKGIEIYHELYSGVKSVGVIGTARYRFVSSL